jgi:hypothetical protein
VERLETVVVEIHHLPAASEEIAIHLLAKTGLDSASGFLEVIHFSNRCTTGLRVLTSELVFLARPTSVLQKLLEGASTVPGIDGDTLIAVSVGTEQNGRPLTSEEEWRHNKATEFSTVSRTIELCPRNNRQRQQMSSWRTVWGLMGGSEQDALHLFRMCANGTFPEWQYVSDRVVGNDARPHCLATMWGREYCRTGIGRVYLEGRLACPAVQCGSEEHAVSRAVHMGVPDTKQVRQ